MIFTVDRNHLFPPIDLPLLEGSQPYEAVGEDVGLGGGLRRPGLGPARQAHEARRNPPDDHHRDGSLSHACAILFDL
jgi:hypothetical protein